MAHRHTGQWELVAMNVSIHCWQKVACPHGIIGQLSHEAHLSRLHTMLMQELLQKWLYSCCVGAGSDRRMCIVSYIFPVIFISWTTCIDVKAQWTRYIITTVANGTQKHCYRLAASYQQHCGSVCHSLSSVSFSASRFVLLCSIFERQPC